MTPEQRTFYFMAGLPRSGSTLLSSILNQNPRIHSGPSSPVTSIMLALENAIAQDELFLAYPKPQQVSGLISSVIHHYYSDVEKPVVIDKNRSWVNRMNYIPGYFGVEPRVICPVRNVDEILASFISMHRRNPFEVGGRVNFLDEMMIRAGLPLTDDARCEFLASPNGILGQSYEGIRQALVQGYQKQLHFVEYDDLINTPRETIRKLYDFLEQEPYDHDFSKIENTYKENDAQVYGLADMHDVRSKLSKESIKPSDILSENILQKCQNTEFWRNLSEVDTETADWQNDSDPINTEIDSDAESKFIGG
jgi:sulfotransferase